jgi:CRP/FNR family transcriptional regulator, nitrogen fixation regulation protein
MSGMMQATQQQPRAIGWQTSMRPVISQAAHDPLDLLEATGSVASLQRDQQLHDQGDPADYCYRIVGGCVRTVKLMEDGRRQIGEFLLPGDLIGFDTLGTHDFAAEAVVETTVRRYRRRDVETLVERNAPLARRLRDLTVRNLHTAYARMLLLGRKTATERIASFLLEMVERRGADRAASLELPMCRVDIADHLGLTTETVCRVLMHLRRDGAIDIARSSLTIKNRRALQEFASEPRH